jgi:hypothetical protein
MPLVPWRQAARYSVSSNTAQNVITALKDAINAEVAANPTTALWQVCDFVTAANTASLTIKPTANAPSGIGARRVFFHCNTSAPPSAGFQGGQTGWSVGAQIIGFGVSPTGNTDVPTTSPQTAAPWTDWLPGGHGYIGTYFTASHLSYFETDQGIIVVLQTALMNSANNNIITMMAGQLAVSLDGLTLYDICAGSYGAWSDRPEGAMINSAIAGSCGPFPTHIPSHLNTANTMSKVKDPQDGIVAVCAGIQSQTSVVTAAALYTKGRRGRNNERYFFPIPMRQVIIAKTKYKMRQMAYGTTGTYGEIISDAGGVKAVMLGSRANIEDSGIWLTEFQP